MKKRVKHKPNSKKRVKNKFKINKEFILLAVVIILVLILIYLSALYNSYPDVYSNMKGELAALFSTADASVIPYDNLDSYWDFDSDQENTLGITINDQTGNNPGTASGNAIVDSDDCVYGGCLNLPGGQDYVNLGVPSFEPGFVKGQNPWTVSMYVKPAQ